MRTIQANPPRDPHRRRHLHLTRCRHWHTSTRTMEAERPRRPSHWTSADKANCVASPSRQSPSPHEKAPLYPVDSSASSVPVALLLSMSVDHLVTAAAVVSALRSVRTTVQVRVVSRVAEPPLFWLTKRAGSDRMAPSFAAPVGSYSPSPLPPPPGGATHDDVPSSWWERRAGATPSRHFPGHNRGGTRGGRAVVEERRWLVAPITKRRCRERKTSQCRDNHRVVEPRNDQPSQMSPPSRAYSKHGQ